MTTLSAIDGKILTLCEEASRLVSWYKLLFLKEKIQPDLVYLLVLFERLSNEEFEFLKKRLSIHNKKDLKVFSSRFEKSFVLKELSKKDIKNSEVYALLINFSVESLLYFATFNIVAKEKISLFINNLSKIKPQLNGKELIKLGIKEGKEIKEVLNDLLNQKLDETISTYEEEVEYVNSKYL